MTTLREAAQQALEALDYCIEHSAEIVAERAKDRGQGSDDLQMMMVEYLEKHRCVITTLRAALAEQAEAAVYVPTVVSWSGGSMPFASIRLRLDETPTEYEYVPARNTAEQAQPVAWAEQIVEHLTALHNTEMIRELDSGDALIRLDDAIAAVDEARDRYTTPPAPQSLRDLCAAAYQVVGVADGPVEMLDNLWAAAEGKPLPHDPGAGLPWSPPAPQPLTIERLRDALVASRIIDPGAVEDADHYDDGLTLHRIEALYRRIA